MYEFALSDQQAYKEAKVILEKALVDVTEGFEEGWCVEKVLRNSSNLCCFVALFCNQLRFDLDRQKYIFAAWLCATIWICWFVDAFGKLIYFGIHAFCLFVCFFLRRFCEAINAV